MPIAIGAEKWDRCMKCHGTIDMHKQPYCLLVEPKDRSYSAIHKDCFIDSITDTVIRKLRENIPEN